MDLMNQNLNDLSQKPNQPTVEDEFRLKDGTIDTIAAQARLQELQKKGADMTQDEIRYCINIIRVLRRTNTGPAASRKKKAAAVAIDPNASILDI